jgi:NitT/TauT family transport system substrate-binding protein
MFRRRRHVLLVLCLVAAVSFDARTARAQEMTAVQLVIGQTETSADGYYALEGGFFKKNGLDVTLTQAKGGAVEAAAVASGAADIGDANIISFANARIHGIPFVALAAGYLYDASDPYVVLAVAPNSPYRTAKDLAGQTIGEPSIGGMAEVSIGAWVEQNGGDLKSIKYVEVPASQSVPALEQGRIAAAVFQDPFLTEQRDRVRVLAATGDAIGKRYLNTLWFSTSDWANKHPDAVKRFQLSINQGAAWADKNPDLARAALEKWLKITVTKTRHFHSDTLDPALIQPFLDAATKYGLLSRRILVSEFTFSPPQ